MMPVFDAGELIGYAAVKGHWLDIGAKDPYATDTVDMHQEGTIYPGLRLYRRGELVDDIYRLALANSRLPHAVAGDIKAEVVAVRTGAAALSALVSRHGLDTFQACVERIFDHGEAVVRSYFERIPDGSYVGEGVLDNDGLSDELVHFDVAILVEGSEVTVDFSDAPPQRPGPVNCTVPKTVAIARIAIGMLAGGGEAPNEGHYRAISVITRPGTLFHPIEPAPSFIGGWSAFQALETVYRAFSQSSPELVPACSGGDICSIVWWGRRQATGEAWADGSPHPVGQGGHVGGDGGAALMHISESATRLTPTEVRETKSPILVSQVELIPDSGGAGRSRGGLGSQGHDMWAAASYIQRLVLGNRCPAMEVRQLSNGGMAAVELAAAYLTAAPGRTAALLTTADRFCLPGFDRWRSDPSTICGDGGTALVLSAGSGFARVRSLVTVSDPGLERAGRGDDPFGPAPLSLRSPMDMTQGSGSLVRELTLPGLVKRIKAGQREAFERATAEADVKFAEIDWYVLPNMGRSRMRAHYFAPFGIAPERTTWEWGTRVGHLGARRPVRRVRAPRRERAAGPRPDVPDRRDRRGLHLDGRDRRDDQPAGSLSGTLPVTAKATSGICRPLSAWKLRITGYRSATCSYRSSRSSPVTVTAVASNAAVPTSMTTCPSATRL